MGQEHLGPHHQMPNHYLNDFGIVFNYYVSRLKIKIRAYAILEHF